MAYAAPLGERTSELRGSRLRRLAGGLATVLGMGVCVGTLLVLLAAAVTDDTPRGTTVGAEPATISLPYGGQLERPDPGDLIEPGGLMGLGLLGLGLANGLVFAFAAALDGTRGPSAAETRRRLRNRRGRGAVPGGRREVARTVFVPAAAPAASAGPLGVVEAEDLPARRSVPGRAAPGTTYAPIPAPRRPEPERHPEPKRLQARLPMPAPAPEPTPAAEATPEPAPAEELAEELVPEPVEEPVEEPDPVPAPRAPRRPSPVPRDGGDGRPSPATRRGTGPWGWRPARPDPVPWRNPRPWPALVGAC
ncbi:hypothetical protein [Actinomycetospora chibensis]|uniref:Uncharacterized protein n=1 Tax=Actinomycetospora chibensis TaxID=663606 RepID=A0ABV9RI64_9PSEU|nr:hypothetical protein [Actinomycetospora chibensis]MDD7924591.1 hypothetical protein [Actinomycetospora chibensis]